MARSRVDTRPQALRDLADIAVYLAEQSGSPDLAYRFLDAARATFEHLTAMPEVGVAREYRRPELEGVRMWRVVDFQRYLVFYRPTDRGVEIIRVIHGNRDIEDLLGSRD